MLVLHILVFVGAVSALVASYNPNRGPRARVYTMAVMVLVAFGTSFEEAYERSLGFHVFRWSAVLFAAPWVAAGLITLVFLPLAALWRWPALSPPAPSAHSRVPWAAWSGLEAVALFNPRFRAMYGWPAILAVGTIALSLFAVGCWWLDPFRPGYTTRESTQLWIGVAVLPIAAVVAGSSAVAFVVKGTHVAIWALRRRVRLTRETKAAGALAALLIGFGGVAAILGDAFEILGDLALVLGALVTFWFVAYAWESTVRENGE